MKRMPVLLTLAAFVVVLGVLGGRALTAQDTGSDKYTVKVPGGLAFSEFRGYESLAGGLHQPERPRVAAILGNPVMITPTRPAFPVTASRSPTAPRWRRSTGTRRRTETFPAADGAGHAARRGLHGEGQQAVRGQRRMGLGRVRVRRRDQHVQARRHDRHAAAGQRRQVRIRVPHDREGSGLRVHGLRAALNGENG